ncbi:PTPc tyrosine phosphatase [Mycobacterium phage Reindeer]|uniref:PTPc tyrosine phosphatase n=1 Tax=Mycobacterium phage Reindeer TaxID=2762283 RepID=A0A7G8LI22_9CAUD|nr:dual specificity phosphatase [Mycobacterium phage Reindeer]QNJ56894.1 PTPc tyrosine phosphatase [Mycobacterium phage Reindeer]
MTNLGVDPTAFEIATDPLRFRFHGWTAHGNIEFDVPFISEVADNLWQGGCESSLVLPTFIKHVVSLYPWEKYIVEHELLSEKSIKMYDSVNQSVHQVDEIAEWVNECRKTGPVLVHCQAGLNRSALIAARAIWKSDDFLTGREIIDHLRSTRSEAVLCNPAFEAEVLSW